MYKNNKKIIIIISVIALLGIGYYIFKTNNSYETFLVDEEVTTEETTKKEEKNFIIVHVAGCVKSPGIIKIEEGSRVSDAIEKAGGLREDADISNINLASILEDGIKIYISSHTEIEEEKPMENNITNENLLTSKNNNDKVNINTASQAELQTLPGIGDSTAQKIVNYRNENGKFKNIEDIKNVKGIGDSKYEKIKNLISTK